MIDVCFGMRCRECAGVSGAVFEPPALVAGFYDVAMVRELGSIVARSAPRDAGPGAPAVICRLDAAARAFEVSMGHHYVPAAITQRHVPARPPTKRQ